MIYIFEGINKVGKSTLLNHIKNVPKIELKRPLSVHEAFSIPYAVLQTCKALNYPDIIMDRCYISELAYNLDIEWELYRELDEAFAYCSRLIYLELDSETLEERWKEKTKPIPHRYSIAFLKIRYEELLKWTSLPVVRINPLEVCLEDIIRPTAFLYR